MAEIRESTAGKVALGAHFPPPGAEMDRSKSDVGNSRPEGFAYDWNVEGSAALPHRGEELQGFYLFETKRVTRLIFRSRKSLATVPGLSFT